MALREGIRNSANNQVVQLRKATDQGILGPAAHPRETLISRSGDFSGSSVPPASSRENFGIQTKLLVTIARVRLRFDTDVLPKNVYAVSAGDRDYILKEGMVRVLVSLSGLQCPVSTRRKRNIRT
jgi:hypothetical protein